MAVNDLDSADGTQAISAASLPLPAGASTSDNQTNGNQQTKLRGNSDGTLIGNVGDKLKVDAAISVSGSPFAWSSKLRFRDMNATNGGVARGTSVTSAAFVNVYSRSGSGFLMGFILNLETFTTWQIKLIIDGVELFESGGIGADDMTSDTIYDLDDVTDVNQAALGISKGSHDRFVFSSPLNIPIKYDSSVTIQVKRTTGGTKKFQGGLVFIQEDT